MNYRTYRINQYSSWTKYPNNNVNIKKIFIYKNRSTAQNKDRKCEILTIVKWDFASEKNETPYLIYYI